VSPFGKIEAIAAVYFPQFTEKVLAFDKGARDYRVWIGKAALARAAGDTADPATTDGFLPAVTSYVAARNALMAELNRFARKEFH